MGDTLKSEQLFQARMKSNDVVQEFQKQIITASTAVLVLTVTFMKEIAGRSPGGAKSIWLLQGSWVLLVIAIVLSVYKIATMANNLDKANDEVGLDGNPRAFAAGTEYVWISQFSIIAFVLGIICLGGFGFSNANAILSSGTSSSVTVEAGSNAKPLSSIIQTVEDSLKKDASEFSIQSVGLLGKSNSVHKNSVIWQVQASLILKGTKDQAYRTLYVDPESSSILRLP